MSKQATELQHFFTKTTLAFVGFALGAIGFVALADEIHENRTTQLDNAILRYINSLSSPAGDTAFVWLTELGGILFVPLFTLLVCLMFWKKGYKSKSIVLAVCVGGAAVLNLVVKRLFERSRPDLWDQLVIEHSFSFPSGHAMASSALAFGIIILFWSTRYRAYALICGLTYMLMIGVSRLYLGVHYPTDVLGGWLLSFAWVSIVWLIWKHKDTTSFATKNPPTQ